MSKDDMGIELWPIDKVTPYANNPRRLGEHAVAKVAASLAAYGWRQPIVVDRHETIVIGHLRRAAVEGGRNN